MHQADHILIHLTLEPAANHALPAAELGADLAAYVRALLDNLDASPVVIGASSHELTLVAPLPPTMSTSHLVHCIKQGTEPWLNRTADRTEFRWAPGYRALSVDLRSLAVTIRRIRRASSTVSLSTSSRWIHERTPQPELR